jgi:hypothetical protein
MPGAKTVVGRKKLEDGNSETNRNAARIAQNSQHSRGKQEDGSQH